MDIQRVSEQITALSPHGNDDGIAVECLRHRMPDLVPNLDAVLEELSRREKLMFDNGRVYPI